MWSQMNNRQVRAARSIFAARQRVARSEVGERGNLEREKEEEEKEESQGAPTKIKCGKE